MTRILGTVLCLACLLSSSLFTSAIAQTDANVIPGKASIKLTFVPQIYSTDGPIAIGEPSVDSLLSRFGVISARPVFVQPVKPEHIEVYLRLGMDRIFELSFADSVPLHAFIEAFTANAVVEFVEPVGNIDLYIEPSGRQFWRAVVS